MARGPRRSPNNEREVRRASTAALADLPGSFPAIESRGETSGSGRVLDHTGFTRGRGERGGKAGSSSAPSAAPREPDRGGVAKGRTPEASDEAQAMNGSELNGGANELLCLPVLPPFSSDRIEPRGGGEVHPNPQQSHATTDRGPLGPGARSRIQLQAELSHRALQYGGRQRDRTGTAPEDQRGLGFRGDP